MTTTKEKTIERLRGMLSTADYVHARGDESVGIDVDELRVILPLLEDDPILDATDGAHPAWWRAHDYVAQKFEALKEQAEGWQGRTQGLSERLDRIQDDFQGAAKEDRVARGELDRIASEALDLAGKLQAKLDATKAHVAELRGWCATDQPALGFYLDDLCRLLDILDPDYEGHRGK